MCQADKACVVPGRSVSREHGSPGGRGRCSGGCWDPETLKPAPGSIHTPTGEHDSCLLSWQQTAALPSPNCCQHPGGSQEGQGEGKGEAQGSAVPIPMAPLQAGDTVSGRHGGTARLLLFVLGSIQHPLSTYWECWQTDSACPE